MYINDWILISLRIKLRYIFVRITLSGARTRV